MNWILVEDELPINGTQNVLLTCENVFGRYVIPDAMWDHGEWKQLMEQEYEVWGGSDYGYDRHFAEYSKVEDKVIAWMLQPLPYGEEDETD